MTSPSRLRAWRRARRVVLTALAAACAEAVPPGPVAPAPAGREPEIRVGLAVGAARVRVGGTEGERIALRDPAGGLLAEVPEGEAWEVRPAGGGLSLRTEGGSRSDPGERIEVAADVPDGTVRVDGRTYRGTVVLLRDRAGITVVNRLSLEAYLAGVVSAEMGRRDSTELEALLAQAVVARTFALRNLGKRGALGFDLLGTAVDQVYGGVPAETAQGWQAVRATRGLIVTHDGAPIDAFFFSTCAGRTETGTEVFQAADRPYLRSLRDVDERGQPYCRISPRYRWREEWSGDQLLEVLRRQLPAEAGVPAERIGAVRDVRVERRNASGRVSELTVALSSGPVTIRGPAIRRVLRPGSGDLLRSANFSLTVSTAGGRVRSLVADGAGAGHGVGFCQWGAVGRARAGQRHPEILASYFRDTTLERAY